MLLVVLVPINKHSKNNDNNEIGTVFYDHHHNRLLSYDIFSARPPTAYTYTYPVGHHCLTQLRTLVLMSASVKSCQADSAQPLSSGVRQGCILAPDLFYVAIDWILDHMDTKQHLEVGGQIFSDLAYADDTAFLFSSEDNIAPCLHSFSHRDSCHPWSKDFVVQDKIAEPGFRSQSNQSADWWQSKSSQVVK